MSVPYIHDEIVHNSSAAEQVLPVLFEIYKPQSILDVGCGLGNWIQVAKNIGVNDIKGVDGAYVNKSLLKINPDEFVEKMINVIIRTTYDNKIRTTSGGIDFQRLNKN